MKLEAVFPSARAAWALLLALLFIPALVRATPVHATEAMGDLELELRLLDVTPSASGRAGAAGVARIEVVVQAAVATERLRLRVLRPDGTPWAAGSRLYDIGQIAWSRPDGGEPLEPDGGPSLAPREALRTILTIPVMGKMVHEIVVEAVGTGASGTLRTENVVRVPFGVPMPVPDDDGEVAGFRLEVRP
jgi:hypothetical protein